MLARGIYLYYDSPKMTMTRNPISSEPRYNRDLIMKGLINGVFVECAWISSDVLDCAGPRQAPLPLLCGFSGFAMSTRSFCARIRRFTSSLRGESTSHQSCARVFFFFFPPSFLQENNFIVIFQYFTRTRITFQQ